MLAEQYRPTTFDDVVGQDKALARLGALRRRGLAGRAYWINGQSGTGKTTIARLIASEVADPFNVVEIDAGELTRAKLAELERVAGLYGMGAKPGRAYLVNALGTIAGSNADESDFDQATWKFGGERFRDRDVELMVSSVIRR